MEHHAKSSDISRSAAKTRDWRDGLLEAMKNPKSIVKEDDLVVVIKDKNPKARHHYLVLPKKNINSIQEVGKQDEEVLDHMEKIAQTVADGHKGHEFVHGYHVVPTMHRLHLHVISTDFDSIYMSSSYLWNSFTTPYFRPSKTVLEELKQHGRIRQMTSSESDGYLQTKLKCHKCSFKPKDISELKQHLPTHFAKKSFHCSFM